MWDRLCAHIVIEGLCWTWVGPTRRHGGGHRPAVSMWIPEKGGTRNFNAARLMLEMTHGPAPLGHEASHLCLDNWLCICPDHLCWETKKENIARRNARFAWATDQESNPDHDPDLFMPGLRAEPLEKAPF